jgi:hypothetical protein
MSTVAKSLAALLLERSLITAAQLEEARALQAQQGASLEDALVRLGYVSDIELARLKAEMYEVAFVDLRHVAIPRRTIDQLPESVAREMMCLPIAVAPGAVWIALTDPADDDALTKLAFILNKHIVPVLALRAHLIHAINLHYGMTETESVDSMLQEFTDTAIELTESAPAPPATGTPGARLDQVPIMRARAQRVSRRATVRYYERMNPQRMFPLLVALSRSELQAIVQNKVAQAQSRGFEVDPGAVVEIEPILPGCSCYPAQAEITVGKGIDNLTFWVVPHVLGRIMDARVVVRQQGRSLAEVPLEIKVTRQTIALLLSCLSLLLPLLLMVMRHFRLDFESQLAEGFGLYAQLGNWLLRSLSPELLSAALLLAAGAAYLWLRPRRRDVFWDLAPSGGR